MSSEADCQDLLHFQIFLYKYYAFFSFSSLLSDRIIHNNAYGINCQFPLYLLHRHGRICYVSAGERPLLQALVKVSLPPPLLSLPLMLLPLIRVAVLMLPLPSMPITLPLKSLPITLVTKPFSISMLNFSLSSTLPKIALLNVAGLQLTLRTLLLNLLLNLSVLHLAKTEKNQQPVRSAANVIFNVELIKLNHF